MFRFIAIAVSAAALRVFSIPCNAQVQPAEQDLVYDKSYEFDVDVHDDTVYTVTSDVQVGMKFLSARSAKLEYLRIGEPFFAPISRLKVYRNESAISGDNISYGVRDRSDVFLSDDKTYTVVLPSLKPGDVISYSYRQKYSDAALLPIFFLPNRDSLSRYQMIFNHPKDISVEFEFYFPRDSVAYTINRSEKDVTSIVFNGLPYRGKLNFFPADDYHAAILVTLKKGEKRISPTRPDEFVAWYERQVGKPQRLDSVQQCMLDAAMKGRRTLADSLAVIDDFVRSTIRYVADERGVNSFVPRPAPVTLKQEFGDCKDRVALVTALAGRYRIPILTTLVQPADAAMFNGVNVGMFNHVICAYYDGQRLAYFDPTAKYCEFGNLPDHYVGSRVFVVNPGGAYFTRTPLPGRKPSLDVFITANIDSLNLCKTEITLRNDFFISALHAQNDLTEEKFRNKVRSFVESSLSQIRIDSFAVTGAGYNEMKVTGRADLAKFLLPSGNKFYVPRAPFAQFDNDVLERRTDMFSLEFDETVNLRLRLQMSSSNLTVQPDSVTGGEGYCYFSSRAGSVGNSILFDFQYYRNTKHIPNQEKEAFMRFHKAYLDNKRNVFVMTRK